MLVGDYGGEGGKKHPLGSFHMQIFAWQLTCQDRQLSLEMEKSLI
jgi:hypothetical protein